MLRCGLSKMPLLIFLEGCHAEPFQARLSIMVGFCNCPIALVRRVKDDKDGLYRCIKHLCFDAVVISSGGPVPYIILA